MLPTTKQSPQARWYLIPLAVAMTLVALALARLAYGILLPTMRAELNLSLVRAGHIGTALSLGYLLLVLPAGMIAGRYGPRLAIASGLVFITAGCAALGVVSRFSLVLSAMLLLGIGTALIYTPMIALLVGWYPARRGTIIGIANSGVGIGVFVTGIYVPWLIAQYGDAGYRLAWYSFSGFSLLLLLLVVRLVRNPPGTDSSAAELHDGTREPFLRRHLPVLQSRSVRIISLVYGILGVTYVVQAIFMYSYAVESGVSPERAGLMFSAGGFLSIFAGTIWGALSDFTGRGVALLLNFFSVMLMTVTPVVYPTEIGFAVHYIGSGLAVGGLFTIIVAATSECVEQRLVPLAVSTVTMALALGQLIGPLAAGSLIDWSGRYEPAFLASASLMFVAGLLSLRLVGIERATAAH